MKNYYWVFLLVIIILSALCMWLYHNPREIKTNTVEIYRDTLYIKEIVRDTIPQIVYEKIKEIKIDTLYSVDSIPVPVYIPIEEKLYSNTLNINSEQDTLTYKAYVSGYKASLDSINFDLKYRVVNTNTIITNTKKDRFNFNVGVYGGYSPFSNKFDVIIGGGFGLNF